MEYALGERLKESDERLVEIAREAPEGDTRAFERLVERHQRKVAANCRYLTRHADDAEDLAQEVFVKAFFNLRGFQGRSAFRTWLQRIKVNHCLNHLKKKQGKVFVDVEDPHTAHAEELRVEPAAERNLASEGAQRLIGRILDSMSDTLRIPLIMRDMDQLSYQEIADALGIGLSAVKMRIKRAREEFQARFREAGGEPSPGGTERK